VSSSLGAMRCVLRSCGGVCMCRTQRFMRAFDHISGTIDRIYKDLTVSRTHPWGAAYLSLESEEEPFLHGIKFTAMPPTKRFRDMEQLSGEKTVAALALLFSIHRYGSPPAGVSETGSHILLVVHSSLISVVGV